MTSIIISQFNEILSSFLVQIIPIVGSTYYNTIQTIIRCNSSLPIDNFLVYAIECREKIMNRDESYFCDKSVVTTVVGEDVKKDQLDEIFRLQNIYGVLDKESKDNVWDILQALLILGEDYIKIKYGNNYQKK
jgi:hypothetical protein